MKKCSMCQDWHCEKCGCRLVGGLCFGPPCHCAGQVTSLQVRLAEIGIIRSSGEGATEIVLELLKK